MKPTGRGEWWDKPAEKVPPEYVNCRGAAYPADATDAQIIASFEERHGYPPAFIAHSGGGHMAGPVVKQLP